MDKPIDLGSSLATTLAAAGGIGLVLGWGGLQELVARKWIWIQMPEKRYLARITISREIRSPKKARARRRNIANWTSQIEMVDPIPNKLNDECYAETAHFSSVDAAARGLVKGMLEDRKKYCGGAKWRPSAERLAKLWKGHARRRKEIEAEEVKSHAENRTPPARDTNLERQITDIGRTLVEYGIVTQEAIGYDGVMFALKHTLNGRYAGSRKTRRLLPQRAFKHAVV